MSAVGTVTSTPPPPVPQGVGSSAPRGARSEESQESAAQEEREQQAPANPAAFPTSAADGVGGNINIMGEDLIPTPLPPLLATGGISLPVAISACLFQGSAVFRHGLCPRRHRPSTASAIGK
jgi:hypothetical protein